MCIETTHRLPAAGELLLPVAELPAVGLAAAAGGHEPADPEAGAGPALGTLNVLLLLATVPLAMGGLVCRRQFDELERLNVSKPDEAPPEKRPDERPRPSSGACSAMVVLGAVAPCCGGTSSPRCRCSGTRTLTPGWCGRCSGLHFLYIVIEVIEFAVMRLWVAIFGLGENQADRRDPDSALTGTGRWRSAW